MFDLCAFLDVRRRHLVVAFFSCVLQVALAEMAEAADWYTGATPAKPANDWIVSVDASVVGTSTGSQFASVAGTIAPIGWLNVSGPRVRLEGLTGTYKFDSAGTGGKITGEQAGGAILGGYQWIASNSSFAAYAGLDVRDTRFSGPAVGMPASGVREGFKGAFEYYATTSERSMLFAYGSYSTVYNAYYTRAKFGTEVIGHAYIGPEIAALGDDYYRQWRVGAHITGLSFGGGLQLGVSGGYLQDQSGKGGGYGSLEFRATY